MMYYYLNLFVWIFVVKGAPQKFPFKTAMLATTDKWNNSDGGGFKLLFTASKWQRT